jgi:hypothetical protein
VIPTEAKWLRVNHKRPCPVCEKYDWCLVAPDSSAAICARTESANRQGEAGWLHRLKPTATARSRASAAKKQASVLTDWRATATTFAANLDTNRRANLAALLKLPPDALDALPLLGFNPDDDTGGCYTFAESDAAENVIGLLRRFGDGKKKAMRDSKRGLVLPTGWQEKPGPVFVVEGPTDTAAMCAAGLCAVGRPSNSGGVKILAALLREREIIIVGENDQKKTGQWPRRDGALSIARGLAAALRRPIHWTLPPAGAKDVRDWLTAETRAIMPWNKRGEELREHLIANAEAVEPPEPATNFTANDAPEILIDTAEYRVNAEAANALGRDPELFQRGGMLVHVVEVQTEEDVDPDDSPVLRRPDPTPIICALPNPLLRERLTRCAQWKMQRGSGEDAKQVPAHPPEWCVAAVGARRNWPSVRRLEAVVPHPVVLRDGTILAANGYDPRSKLLVCLPRDLTVTVSDRPTPTDVRTAVAVLSDVVSDFPFQTPAHRAAWFAGLLTPLAWFAFSGPAPLFLVDANIRAAGKGLLADVIALIITGRRFPVMSYTSEREELRKRITTLAVEGDRMVLLDNLAGAVGNDILDAALTADRWKDRILGGNKVYDGPLHICWYATGNNVQLHADTARRVCHCRMETADERPEMKTGFKYPDLRAHVRANRGTLLSAALAILRGWVAAKRPTHGLTPWGSFEGWSSVVRESLVFAGLPDPGETRLELQTTSDRDALAMLVALARFGGLRIPSEAFSLTWGDVDWERNRLTIPSPKTRSHGKPHRVIPLFPLLRPHLEAAFEHAEEGKRVHHPQGVPRACGGRTRVGRCKPANAVREDRSACRRGPVAAVVAFTSSLVRIRPRTEFPARDCYKVVGQYAVGGAASLCRSDRSRVRPGGELEACGEKRRKKRRSRYTLGMVGNRTRAARTLRILGLVRLPAIRSQSPRYTEQM